jgi:hypothetical protein
MTTNICENCGESDPTTIQRVTLNSECDRCWADALQFGHEQGLHNEQHILGCPLCPQDDAIEPEA